MKKGKGRKEKKRREWKRRESRDDSGGEAMRGKEEEEKGKGINRKENWDENKRSEKTRRERGRRKRKVRKKRREERKRRKEKKRTEGVQAFQARGREQWCGVGVVCSTHAHTHACTQTLLIRNNAQKSRTCNGKPFIAKKDKRLKSMNHWRSCYFTSKKISFYDTGRHFHDACYKSQYFGL